MLNGLNMCPLCRSNRDKVKFIRRNTKSNLNFVNKKLTLELNSRKNEDKIIEDVIDVIE